MKNIERPLNAPDKIRNLEVYNTQVNDMSFASLLIETGQQTGHPFQGWVNNRRLETRHWYEAWVDDENIPQRPLYESSLYAEKAFNTGNGVMVHPYQLEANTDNVSTPIITSCSSMSLKVDDTFASGEAQLKGYHVAKLTVGEFLNTIGLFGYTMKSLADNCDESEPVPVEAVAKFIWQMEKVVLSTREAMQRFLLRLPWNYIYRYNDDWSVEKNYRMLGQLVRSMTRMRWGIFEGQHRALNLYCGYRGHLEMKSVVSMEFPEYHSLQLDPAVDEDHIDWVLMNRLPNGNDREFHYLESHFVGRMRFRVATAGKESLHDEFKELRTFGCNENAAGETHIKQSIQSIVLAWEKSLEQGGFQFKTFDEKKLWELDTKINGSQVIGHFSRHWFKNFYRYIEEHGLGYSLERIAQSKKDNCGTWVDKISDKIDGHLKTTRYFISGKEQECNGVPRNTGVIMALLKFVMTSKERFQAFITYMSLACLEQPQMQQMMVPMKFSLARYVSPEWLRLTLSYALYYTGKVLSSRIVFEKRLITDMALINSHAESLQEDPVDLEKMEGLENLKDLRIRRWRQQHSDMDADFTCLLQAYVNTPMLNVTTSQFLADSHVHMKNSSVLTGKYDFIIMAHLISAVFAKLNQTGMNPKILSKEEAIDKAKAEGGHSVYDNSLLDIYLQ